MSGQHERWDELEQLDQLDPRDSTLDLSSLIDRRQPQPRHDRMSPRQDRAQVMSGPVNNGSVNNGSVNGDAVNGGPANGELGSHWTGAGTDRDGHHEYDGFGNGPAGNGYSGVEAAPDGITDDRAERNGGRHWSGSDDRRGSDDWRDEFLIGNRQNGDHVTEGRLPEDGWRDSGRDAELERA